MGRHLTIEKNLLPEGTGQNPLRHPLVPELLGAVEGSRQTVVGDRVLASLKGGGVQGKESLGMFLGRLLKNWVHDTHCLHSGGARVTARPTAQVVDGPLVGFEIGRPSPIVVDAAEHSG